VTQEIYRDEAESIGRYPVAGGAGAATALDRRLVRLALARLGDPGCSVVLWDGAEVWAPHTPIRFRVRVHSRRALLALCRDPAARFGVLYGRGEVEVEGDLAAAMAEVNRSLAARPAGLFESLRRHLARPRWGSGAEDARRVRRHYDLGNDFFRLWLDRDTLQYTCAYYPEPGLSLEQAQLAKAHHVCRKLRLTPGESVLEAGCGWGGLASIMARDYGVKVTAYNVSREQIGYARARLRDEGLEGRVTYVEDDYRNIRGHYDAFVSIGMLEHVGSGRFGALGAVIDRCLEPNGRGLIQFIGRNAPVPMNAWAERHIFPGAYPPSLREVLSVFEPHGFSVLDVENLRLHYVKTLRDWLGRYEVHAEVVQRRYGNVFARSWRLYLSASLAAFDTGWLQLFQVLFSRPGNNDLPWSRAHLYGDRPS
jgi:cyclopropane-fatty-acyl-phospholipid synthase